MKVVAERFSGRALNFFGLNTARVVEAKPTVLPTVEAKESRVDFVFLLEDNTLIHLEFQTRAGKENLFRFANYDYQLIMKYNMPVNTVIIYSGRVEEAPAGFNMGSLQYNVQNIYMKSYDADTEYASLNEKITGGKELSDEDILKLIFLPLMKSGEPEEIMAVKAAELAKSLEGQHRLFPLAALVAITDKFMPKDQKKRLLEVLKMTEIEQMIREEGRQEERKELAKKMIAKGIPVTEIAELTGLSEETITKMMN